MKKNAMHIGMTGLLLAVLLPLRVFAQGSDGFRLDQSGMVTLDSSHAAKEGISSFCFSLTVEPENAGNVEFVFAGDLAEIMEYRYNADEKKLNVYMAGTESLFAEGTESLPIGKVVVTDGSGRSVRATVGVAEGSLQFVYGSEARTMEDVDIPDAVQIGLSSGGSGIMKPAETVTPPPAETPAPEAPQTPANPQDSGLEGTGTGGTQQTGGQNSAATTPRPTGTQVAANQGTNNDQESSAQESSSTQEPEPEDSAQPSEEPSSEPVESEEEELESASAESRQEEENLSAGEGGFWEEMKPLLTGLGIGALVLAIGAVVVVLLIKAPKRK